MIDHQGGAPTERPTVSAVVLAGGKSRRMGRDKATLLLHGQTLLARTVQTVSRLTDDIVVVTGDSLRYGELLPGVRQIPDDRPGVGSLMGVYSGLKNIDHDLAVVVACDLPLLSLPLLAHLLSLAPGHDVVVPQIGEFLEPLHGIYRRTCLEPIREKLAAGQRRIVGLYDEVTVRYVGEEELRRFDPMLHSFVNLNTSADWQRVLEILSTASDGAS
jgi:molybdopterin-guanine dinucleotide biosynthesis protein A